MMQTFRRPLVIMFLAIWSCTVSISFGQTRPSGGSDFKVRYKTTFISGGQTQSNESVTMIKGARERSESRMGYGYDSINITQCDLKRTIQISDTVRKYFITPLESETSPATTATTAPATKSPASNARTGGTVTYVTTSIDTGERREMFGFTARHVKSSTTIQSSPDACNPVNQRTELDGWYIDLSVSFNCQTNVPATALSSQPATVSCRDQTKFRREGNGRLGFPLIETMRMYDASGQVTFSNTKEVLELSRESLDSALFDVPVGYVQATSQQELYSPPSAAEIMGNTAAAATGTVSDDRVSSATANEAKQPGTIRVGVVQINNKSGKVISAEALRQRLIRDLQGSGVDAVVLNGISPPELEAEARNKQCDYILYSDLTALKTSKLGGLFGSVTGSGIGKTEAKIEFKLFPVGENKPVLQSSATAKEEGDENSAGAAIDSEARTVVTEVKKRKG